MSFVGGRLNLKGLPQAKEGPSRVHKIQKKEAEKAEKNEKPEKLDAQNPASAPKTAPKAPTKAELELERRREAKLAEQIKRELAIPHREKLRKYNNYLEGLNTLFDLPRTGSG